jgi:dTDP-4-dehydrorhamnose 3,5-epimerase
LTLRFSRTGVPGVIVIEPEVHRDDRGFFLESYHARKYREAGIDATFVQDNHSYSTRGTLRGLHAQSPHAQAKLVRVIEGEIFDVAVDLRRGSPTFGRVVTAVLSSDNCRQLYVPRGLAHGFLVTSAVAQVEYKCSDFYDPEAEFAIAWNDPQLGISWPVDAPLLSKRDAEAPSLSEVEDRLLDWDPEAG